MSGGYLMKCLPDLLVSLGIIYLSRGLTLPNPPHEIRINAYDERGIESEEFEQIRPFIYLANKIAMLPKGDFQFALERMEYYRHPVSKVFVDTENYRNFELKEALNEIRCLAISPFENTFIAVDTEEDKAECKNLISELQKVGQMAADTAKAFLKAERDCAIDQRYFRESSSAPNDYQIDMETDSTMIW